MNFAVLWRLGDSGCAGRTRDFTGGRAGPISLGPSIAFTSRCHLPARMSSDSRLRTFRDREMLLRTSDGEADARGPMRQRIGAFPNQFGPLAQLDVLAHGKIGAMRWRM